MHALPQRTELLLAGLLLAVGMARIVATYPVFVQTHDEPQHIATGMEWLDHGTYKLMPQNPPLARVAAAIGPYLDGARFRFIRDQDTTRIVRSSATSTGNAILYSGHYQRRLTLARLGILPFFAIAALAVWWWTRRLGGPWAALAALLLFTHLPPILGHAGLATTDMAIAAGVAAALFAFWLWLEEPGLRTAALLGVGMAFAVLAKFSALFFVPAGAIAIFVVMRRRVHPSIAIAFVVAFLLIAAAYRLQLGDLVTGIRILMVMSRRDDYPAYFLGKVDPGGHPLYFPLLLLVKTPLPLLFLWLAAFVVARKSAPLAASVAILLCGFLMQTQGGLRYLLPIYPLMAIAAGLAAVALWERGRVLRWLAALALVVQVGATTLAHPDYLAWFNPLAGRHPERIVVDSDLDWGQDLIRLRETVRELGIRELHLAYFGSADPLRHDLGAPVILLRPGQRATGWVAVSESYRHPIWTDGHLWVTPHPPVRRVGRSIWLYRVP